MSIGRFTCPICHCYVGTNDGGRFLAHTCGGVYCFGSDKPVHPELADLTEEPAEPDSDGTSPPPDLPASDPATGRDAEADPSRSVHDSGPGGGRSDIPPRTAGHRT